MKIIPTGSIVVTSGGQFLSLRRGVEVDVPDDLAQRLIDGGNATEVEAAPVKAPEGKTKKGKKIDAAPENKAD